MGVFFEKLQEKAEMRIDLKRGRERRVIFFVHPTNPVWGENGGKKAMELSKTGNLLGNWNDCGVYVEIVSDFSTFIEKIDTKTLDEIRLIKKDFSTVSEWEIAENHRAKYVQRYNRFGRQIFGGKLISLIK